MTCREEIDAIVGVFSFVIVAMVFFVFLFEIYIEYLKSEIKLLKVKLKNHD